MTYFRMGKPHTIIGAESFHCRVRDGIGWFRLAMAARQSGGAAGLLARALLLEMTHWVDMLPRSESSLGVIWSSLTGH